MDVSNIPERIWKKILLDDSNHNYESLSLKIMLARHRAKLRMNPGTESECIGELKELFELQGKLPSLQRDILKIKAKGGIL